MRPLIGITCRLAQDSSWRPEFVGVRRGYVDGVIAANGLPLLIPPQADIETLQQIYRRIDGLLLTGGADIDPALYGEERHPQLGVIEPDRDRTELLLTRWAVADGKPLLGICRGMQMLNVALGGTLYQDIGSQYTTELDHERGSHEQSWRNHDHAITLEPSSRLATLLGTTGTTVNTLHHQSLKTLADELIVVGQAPDGIVEAVEGTGDDFVLGVQCHPEELWQDVDPRWRNVFGELVVAATTWQVAPRSAALPELVG